jgi:short-subunit dehydrogenase
MTRDRGFALITGASWGIGTEFAHQLARDGYDLVLTARSEDRLRKLQTDLADTGRTIHIVPADLSSPLQTRALQTRIQTLNVEVELLVNNAAFGSGGSFARREISRELSMIDLNVRSLVELTHFFLQGMRQRGHGGVINVGSIAGFLSIPFMATYAATKAFVLSFSQALYYENRPQGVHVMVTCPGPTETNFFTASNIKPMDGPTQTAEAVVKESMRAFYKKRSIVVTGLANKATIAALRLAPRALALSGAGKAMAKRKDDA